MHLYFGLNKINQSKNVLEKNIATEYGQEDIITGIGTDKIIVSVYMCVRLIVCLGWTSTYLHSFYRFFFHIKYNLQMYYKFHIQFMASPQTTPREVEVQPTLWIIQVQTVHWLCNQTLLVITTKINKNKQTTKKCIIRLGSSMKQN